MALTLLGSPLSPFVRKVQIFLLEKQLAFEMKPISPFDPPDGWREISPLGKIPVLRHDDRVINDSSVICRYLEALAPSPALYPSDPYLAACAEWLEEYIDGGLIPQAGPAVFFNRVIRPMMGQETDEALAQRTIEEGMPTFFDYLEGQLRGGDFLIGEGLTIADITVSNAMVNFRFAGVLPEEQRWPKLNRYLLRWHERDTFQATIEPLKDQIGKLWVEAG